MYDNQNAKHINMVRNIIWLAFIVSMIMYLVVAYMAVRGKTPTETSGTITTAITLLAIVDFFVVLAIRTRFRLVKDENFPRRIMLRDIITWALAEAISLFGFVLTFLSYRVEYAVYFTIPALILLFLLRPQEIKPAGEAT